MKLFLKFFFCDLFVCDFSALGNYLSFVEAITICYFIVCFKSSEARACLFIHYDKSLGPGKLYFYQSDKHSHSHFTEIVTDLWLERLQHLYHLEQR